ncbi:MAG TPA: hypothetical protein VMK42_20660 [Anaeromyxobacteraceae bacterium]|nr:hypothetical protein [Anaeromyxobacteraceae bacterium]
MRHACIAFLLLAACVSTKTTAVRSAEFNGAHFSGVLVFVNTSDMEKRRHYEDALVRELAARRIPARPSLDLFPPIDAVTPEVVTSRCASAGLDTALTVVVAGESHQTVITGQHTNANCYGTSNGTATAYATGPGTATANYSGTSSANCYGNTYNTTATQHAMGIEIRLTELASGKTVWMAQSQGSGGAGGVFGKMGMGSDIIEHMAKDIGDQIAVAGLF